MVRWIVVLSLLVAMPAVAGDITLSWNNPDRQVFYVDAGELNDLEGTRIWQLVGEVEEGVTEFVVEDLKPGDYTFAASAFNSGGEESRLSGVASKTVDTFTAKVGATVYQVVSIKNGFWLLPVGAVAEEVECDIDQSVKGRYAVPIESVNFTGTTDPLVVVADCG